MKSLILNGILGSSLLISAAVSSVALGSESISTKIGLAKTPADHEAIAKYYDQEAKEALEKSQEHKLMAGEYKKYPRFVGNHQVPIPATHCDSLSREYSDVAADDTALAGFHRDMASEIK